MVALTCSGCLVTRVKWHEPVFAKPANVEASDPSAIAQSERSYARAVELEEQGSAACVDHYFQVAVATEKHDHCGHDDCRACELHKSALMKVVTTGQRFGRLDRNVGLTIKLDGICHVIPIDHRGFVWKPDDFRKLIPVGHYRTNAMSREHQCDGVGIPLVVRTCHPCDNDFIPDHVHFAATLRLNVCACAAPSSEDNAQEFSGESISAKRCQLQLYDPLRVCCATVDGIQRPLAKDTSAPLVYALRNNPRTYLTGFLTPDSSNENDGELYMLEPYQPGKIPVVLIHGLLSDPYTWLEFVNEMRACRGFVEHFQLWVFEYSTGEVFLSSATELRQQLKSIRNKFDSLHHDPQLSNMVLVGHSMGGLIAKLQVTQSGDDLWNSVSFRPFHQIRMRSELRQEIAASFFFEPTNDVSRVIFIGTPHKGSNYSRRIAGRLGSALVRRPEQQRQEHEQLMRANPDAFSPEVRKRIPTSIDLLDTESCLLKAIDRIPIRQDVCLHSIIGDHFGGVIHERTDGVVPVYSARHPQAISEKLVPTNHANLNKHRTAIEETVRILNEHLRQHQPSFVRPAI